MKHTLTVALTEQLVDAMASGTGDYSSIHMSDEFARRTRFRERIVHGMLPVALTYLLWSGKCAQGQHVRVAKVACRFLDALRIGDRVELSVTADQASGETVKFEIRHAASGALATSGQFLFVPSTDSPRPGEEKSLLAKRLDEQVLLPAEMAPGTERTLDFRASSACVHALVEALPAEMREQFGTIVDGNFSAALAVSTLIGMLLPGRYATFTELSADFGEAVQTGRPITLRGKVSSASTATNRARLALSWIQSDVEIGQGQANTLVNPVDEGAASISSIRQQASFGIEGKVALVTGASRGIGAVTAKLLAMHGVKTVVHYFKGQRDAQTAVADIEENGGVAVALQADLRDGAEITRMFDEIRRLYGGVDILINNAVSQFSPKDLLALSTQDYLAELNVSLFGMHECCRQVIPHMKEQGWGKIINLGTIATEAPVSGQNLYITAKAAVSGYTRSLSAELASSNIQANVVLPRMTETSLIASLPRSLVEKLAEESVAGRLLQPIEVAKVIVFLASDWSNPISGQRFALNQGEMPYL